MGTQVHYRSCLPSDFLMRDLDENSNICSWPQYRGDRSLLNGQYCNGFMPRAVPDAYLVSDKEAVKQKMLEHEAIFRKQVCELHRLYSIQRDLMEEIRRTELHKNPLNVGAPFSSSLESHITSQDARKWQLPSFPVANYSSGRPSISCAEDARSSFMSMDRNNGQASHFASQNGSASKDFEVLESRPMKVRKKMFDLQLPADEYIDSEEGEQFSDETAPGISNFFLKSSERVEPGGGVRLYPDNGEKTSCCGGAIRSDSSLQNSYALTDLNKPVQLEETNGPAYVNLLGHISLHGETPVSDQKKLQLLGLPREIPLNSNIESNDASRESLCFKNYQDDRGKFLNVPEAGHGERSKKSDSEDLQRETLPIPSHVRQVFPKQPEHSSFYLSDKGKVEQRPNGPDCDFKFSDRSHEISNNRNPGAFEASHVSSPYRVGSSSDLGRTWIQSISSWDKPSTTSLHPTKIPSQTHSCYSPSALLQKSCESSSHSNGIFGDMLHRHSESRIGPGGMGEVPCRNGFYLGSFSGYKEGMVCSSSTSYDHLNCSNGVKRAPLYSADRDPASYCKVSDYMGVNLEKDMNLDVALLSNNLSKEAVPRLALQITAAEQKNRAHPVLLPWLKTMPPHKGDSGSPGMLSNAGELSFVRSSINQSSDKHESGIAPAKSVSGSNDLCRRTELGECPSSGKLLGFPVFEQPHVSKNNSVSVTSRCASLPRSYGGEAEGDCKTRVLDINLPCEPSAPESRDASPVDPLATKGKNDCLSSVRNLIDLNACASDDEASMRPSAPCTKSRNMLEIDLEAPAVPEMEDDISPGGQSMEKQRESAVESSLNEVANLEDELTTVAAETLIALSLSDNRGQSCDATSESSGDSSADRLNWFVEVVFLLRDDVDGKVRGRDGRNNDGSCSHDLDYFECMTLGLEEAKEEDYMPAPLVPESLKLEETGTGLSQGRPRKGLGRRGRQRRDFQRDILPGLASLSRHEVTEDLQTFGGLMRATGHCWHSGVTRRNSSRNGCGRGRRQAVATTSPPGNVSSACNLLMQQLSNFEMGLEDGSLTGWGKTTRRPRRQRFPPVNPPTVI